MKKIYERVEQQFKSRAEANNLKPGSKKYQVAQADFFTGAMAALIAVGENSVIYEDNGNEFYVFGDKMKELELDVRPMADQEDVRAMHGRSMPPKWVFGMMRGDDICKP